MKKFYIDTSVFISALLADEFAESAVKILKSAAREDCQAYTSSFTLNELVFVMRDKRKSSAEIKQALDFIKGQTEIMLVSQSISSLYAALDLKEAGVELNDAIHAAVAAEIGIQLVASFDSDFDKIKGIKRITAV